MKRLQYNRYGGPSEIRLESVKAPAPGKGEVLVRIHAAAIDPVDWKLRQGAMKMMTGRKMPRAMGLDFAGEIERVGRSTYTVGDEVVGAAPPKQSGTLPIKLSTRTD